MKRKNNFEFVDKTFINLYSDDNPPLEIGDICYFLFSNIIDIHRPLIGKGLIVDNHYNDGLNKTYFIELLSVEESKLTIDKFLSKPVFFYKSRNAAPKNYIINDLVSDKFYKTNLLRIDAFFVRLTKEQVVELRKEFVEIIKNDLNQQIKDIENI